jgi:hypothetical protein
MLMPEEEADAIPDGRYQSLAAPRREGVEFRIDGGRRAAPIKRRSEQTRSAAGSRISFRFGALTGTAERL